MEKPFLNKEYNLTVYETGQFSGIPNNFPREIPRWQDTGFGFQSSLMILKHN